MRRLLSLLRKYGTAVTFLALQGISVYLIVMKNSEQKAIFVSSIKRVFGDVHEVADRLYDIKDSRKQQEELRASVEELKEQVFLLQQRVALPSDTLQQDTSMALYTFIGARVIKNSVDLQHNFFTIDRGTRDGVQKHMGVITNDGVVGIVREVNSKYALVMSVLNRSFILSARSKKSGQFGPVVWTGEDERYVTLTDIPQHVRLNLADTIQTSGYSSIFPKGVDIGTIVEVKEDNGASKKYSVKLFEDMRGLEHVYVVNYVDKDKIEELEKLLADE
ncbi:MAG: rod shape-determining protein MreC [Bacteroidota bacterium]